MYTGAAEGKHPSRRVEEQDGPDQHAAPAPGQHLPPHHLCRCCRRHSRRVIAGTLGVLLRALASARAAPATSSPAAAVHRRPSSAVTRLERLPYHA